MSIEFSNFAAIAAAAIVSFAFGAVWYMTLSKQWLAAVGKSDEEAKAAQSPRQFIIAIICQLVIAFFLNGLGESLGMADLGGMMLVALTVWAGVVMTTMLINHTFQSVPVALTVIDGGHWLGVLLIQAIALSLINDWIS